MILAFLQFVQIRYTFYDNLFLCEGITHMGIMHKDT